MNNLFIYTGPHPAHDALANALNCKKVKSNGKIPFFGRILNAMAISNKTHNKQFDIILTESISRDLLAGAYYKYEHPKTKLVALLTDPKLLELNTAPWADRQLTLWSLVKADLLLVGSEMMFNLVPIKFRYKTKFFWPGIENIDSHLTLNAKFGKNLVFIGKIDDYKGTDLLYKIFRDIKHIDHMAKLYVAGDGPNSELFKNHIDKGINYLGKTESSLFMHDVASFYITKARYEPSGVAIIEAMAQGLVPMVSEGVGYNSIVREVDPRLVTKTDNDILNIYKKLINDKKEWTRLSKKCKKVAAKYSYGFMITDFKNTLRSFFKDTNI